MDSFEIEVIKARDVVRRARLPGSPRFEFARSSGFWEVEGRRFPAGDVVTVSCFVPGAPAQPKWQQIYKSNRYFSWLFAFADDIRNGVVAAEAQLAA